MHSDQVAFEQSPVRAANGLRERKKERTRLAIEDAAVALFETKGYDSTTVEEIAEQAEVSPTTFFRYFPTKADVLLADHGQRLAALFQAIVSCPSEEDDLTSVRRAIQQEWVAAVDPNLTARKARIIATSDQLRGMSFQRGHRWLTTVSDALARRHGLDSPDIRSVISARVALAALAQAVEGWIANGCVSDLPSAVEDAFDTVGDLSREWSSPSVQLNR